MVDRDLIDAFNECIDLLAAGQSIDDCLRRYPQYADVLRPMLEAGLLARRAQVSPTETADAQARGRARFQDALRKPAPPRVYRLSWARLAAGVLLVFMLSSVGISLAAQDSLPGDPLYNVKRLTESVQLVISGSSPTLQAAFEERRIAETHTLLALGREAQVTLEGVITQIDEATWQLADLQIQIDPTLPDAVLIQSADRVMINARTTRQGTLIAETIRLLGRTQPQTLPTVRPSTTLTHTATVLPTATSTSTASPTTSPTPTSRPASATPRTVSSTPGQRILATAPPNALSTVAPPSPTSVVTCLPQHPDDWIEYSIQSGDTLSNLAQRSGITLERLLRVNCITNADIIRVGQRIYLPGGTTSPSTPDVRTEPTRQPPAPTQIEQNNTEQRNNDVTPQSRPASSATPASRGNRG